MRTVILLAACAWFLMAVGAVAGHFCKHCGCQRNCRKVCHLVCEKKEETKIEYTCECEDFCIPCPSKKCGIKVECDCDGKHRKIVWQPTCAKVHTRKKLVKKETKKEVPNYKWVVEEYCCVCGQWVKTDHGDKDDKSDDGESKKPSAKDGGSSQDGKSGAATDDGDQPKPDQPKPDEPKPDQPKPERLPPPATMHERQAIADPLTESYYAYYLGADPGYSKQKPPAHVTIAEFDDESDVAEVRIDEPDREPRRLFLGLFGR